MSGPGCLAGMMPGIVGEMAALAPGAKIIVTAILRHMVQVRNRQHNMLSRHRVRLSVLCAAPRISRAPLTAIARPPENPVPDFFPVCRVPLLVFWFYRHL